MIITRLQWVFRLPAITLPGPFSLPSPGAFSCHFSPTSPPHSLYIWSLPSPTGCGHFFGSLYSKTSPWGVIVLSSSPPFPLNPIRSGLCPHYSPPWGHWWLPWCKMHWPALVLLGSWSLLPLLWLTGYSTPLGSNYLTGLHWCSLFSFHSKWRTPVPHLWSSSCHPQHVFLGDLIHLTALHTI